MRVIWGAYDASVASTRVEEVIFAVVIFYWVMSNYRVKNNIFSG